MSGGSAIAGLRRGEFLSSQGRGVGGEELLFRGQLSARCTLPSLSPPLSSYGTS